MQRHCLGTGHPDMLLSVNKITTVIITSYFVHFRWFCVIELKRVKGIREHHRKESHCAEWMMLLCPTVWKVSIWLNWQKFNPSWITWLGIGYNLLRTVLQHYRLVFQGVVDFYGHSVNVHYIELTRLPSVYIRQQ